ncbi:hypothetical protein [Absidia glauca]|uniref:Transcription activator GCR1-like domain-containing protein n=1 Tax=Absidia glauca TaxID=4829 RepID=A0A168S365_ABSGL|nr:hypothetical protein [Absidia glauca]
MQLANPFNVYVAVPTLSTKTDNEHYRKNVRRKKKPMHTNEDGLAGNRPVEMLERQWAVEWREDRKERKFLNRRRSIITNITIETAANVAEERRSRFNKHCIILPNIMTKSSNTVVVSIASSLFMLHAINFTRLFLRLGPGATHWGKLER